MDDATDVADRLHSASIHLLRRVRREDEGGRVTPAQSSALSVIVYSGPLSLGELAKVEQVRSPTMTRVVDHLVATGMVVKEPAADDARRTLIRATAAGVKWIAEGRRKRVSFLAKRFTALPDEDMATLRRAAELLAQVLEHPHHD